ncbi:uncharacterized protein FOMMEDRAFT_102453 [Fomitiporia mediterranea MF3/22]|uniref:uncharacterized protein n=1 Tax=Fomitiporia mediterranea (strain MF3/22) TaxID=694068 RepID=UPI0004408C9B|nr:uncharacterized protein FOMMEDRAFT_102453 [Fomitiporia mediterranea MF3/22]EJD06600.1 hypothetical protein FOMMEDRAFT_102453 [Fomitiporia mediterranea MF3/22]
MDDDRHVGAFSWHQSLDQATINILVPHETILDDLDIVIDPPYVVASIRGKMPILKGKIYEAVNKEQTHWNFEPTDNPRRRTTSTASTISTQSSYAYVSDAEISSSFAASLESAQVSDNDDSDFASPERSHPVSRDEQAQRMNATITIPAFPQRAIGSFPASPQMQSMESSLSSLDSLRPERPEKLLTIVLVKTRPAYWPRVIDGPVPDTYSPTPSGPFTFDPSVERQKYNMDPTSLGLWGEEYLKLRSDREEAFEYFVRSWHYLHTPFSALRLVTYFLPVTTIIPASILSASPQSPPSSSTLPRRGTVEYYVLSLGGIPALGQLFLEAGLAHLDGIATKLLSSNYSPLNSIRRTEPPVSSTRVESSTQLWRRDRTNARTYFERARKLAPSMDGSIPFLPEETDLHAVDRPGRGGRTSPWRREGTKTGTSPPSEEAELELQMPSMFVDEAKTIRPETKDREKAHPESTVRVRRRRQQASEALLEQTNEHEQEEDSTWYLYLPGLVGAGTALLVVSVVGALSFQSWRKNNN